MCVLVVSVFFFFKQKTAYELRISDWSSDVCSSDLLRRAKPENLAAHRPQARWLHLQPDDEEEHDDAEFGDVQDSLGIRKQRQPEGADRKARRDIAKHRPAPTPLKQGEGDQRGGVMGRVWAREGVRQ